MSRWKREYFCVNCDTQLSWGQKMNSHGCCFGCGFLSEGSICATNERSSEVSVAWTIWKLNAVRWLLKPLLRLHIWWVTRQGRREGGL